MIDTFNEFDYFPMQNYFICLQIFTDRVDEKYASAPHIIKIRTLFGNPFYEFKLWLIPEVTLHNEVSFGKKRTFQPHPSPQEDAYTIATNFQKAKKSVSAFFHV